jgi:endonuclease/exonuclease/phosphatase family metal-dependent hydrolase
MKSFTIPLIVVLVVPGCREGFDDDAGGAGTTVATSSAGGANTTDASSVTVGVGGSSNSADVSVMTWNIENLPKSTDAVPKVVATIESLRPDLIGVQEIKDLGAWDALDAALTDYEGALASEGDGYVRVGLLYRTDRLMVDDIKTVLSNDSYAFPRPMITAKVASKVDPSHDFIFGVVHLKAQLDPESQARRKDACAKLDAWAIDEQESDTEIVIVGDFNDEVTDSPNYNVFGPLLTTPDGAFVTLPLAEANEFTYIPFASLIDHVHVRGAMTATSSAKVITLDEQDPTYEDTVSDHRPVLATLRWPD